MYVQGYQPALRRQGSVTATRSGLGGKVLAAVLSLPLTAAVCPLGVYGQEDSASSGTQAADTASVTSTPANTTTASASDSLAAQQDTTLTSQLGAIPALQTGSILATQSGSALTPQSVTDSTGLVYDIRSTGTYGAGAYVTGYSGTSKAVAVPVQLGGADVVSVTLKSLALISLDAGSDNAFVFSRGTTPPLHVPASWAGTNSFTAANGHIYKTTDGSLIIDTASVISSVSVSRTSAQSASVSFTSSISGSATVLDASGVALWSGSASANTPVTASFSGVGPASATLTVKVRSGKRQLGR
jgi:hypothetical protein